MTTKNLFREWLDSITIAEYADRRKEVITRCRINSTVFRNWRLGITAVPELAKPIINEIAGYEVFNLNKNEEQ